MKDAADAETGRLIIVCPPLKSSIQNALRRLKGKPFRWAYLGENSLKSMAVERFFGGNGQRLETGDRLQATAESLRQPYIDYIGKLSLTYNSLEWWANSFSDKNLWYSKTFLYSCYVRLCRDLVNEDGQENLVLIGENATIRQGLLANLEDSSQYEKYIIETALRNRLDVITKNISSFITKVKFLATIVYRRLLAGSYRLKASADKPSDKTEGMTLIHSWIFDRSFDNKGEYHDIYLGDLATHLKNKGKRVVIVPYILYASSYRQTLKKLKQSIGNFLLPESYLKLSDIMRIFFKTLSSRDRRAYPDLQGMKIAGIVADDIKQHLQRTDLTHNLLLYEAIKRWKRAGVNIDSLIYTYENHTWEKVYCLALREFYPSVKIIGYQHSTVPRMLLNYFFAREELPVLPFPDKVITNGRYTEKLFKESGYDPARVVRGGAIRYAGLLQKKAIPPQRDATHPVILVTPSMDKNETVELVGKVIRAFSDKKQYKIILKFHPAFPYRFVKEKTGTLPQHFNVSETPISELLQECNVLVYTITATSIEALALGVPVLHIKSDLTIDRDNLADYPQDIRASASTPENIVKAVEKILKMDEAELSRKRRLWAEVVAEMFGPVDEGTFDLFL
jgi:glycosyltransferase involved in cell wall biosynthesis